MADTQQYNYVDNTGATKSFGAVSSDAALAALKYMPNANPQSGVSLSAPTSSNSPTSSTQSTTTLSSANKASQVPGIVDKTNTLSQTGASTDANGNVTAANGTILSSGDQTQPPTPPVKNTTGLSTGGYVGDVYYAPGMTLPTDANGKPQQTTPTSPASDQITNNLNTLKAQVDAHTASAIDSIHAQYAQLIQQQQQINAGQEAKVNNALLMGGVTGQGSSSQFAPISSSGIIHAQINYGLQQIANLNAKENQDIVAAQQAGDNQDFKLMDSLNQQIEKTRQEKVDAANKMNDILLKQNQKMAEDAMQSTKDTSVANLYASGITDPAQILKQLQANGVTNVTSTDVANTIKNIANKSGVDTSSLDAISKEFFALKDSPNGLPSSITSLPDTASQLAAFIKMYTYASASAKALVNPSGTQPSGTINGYDFSTYATDPTKVTQLTQIVNTMNNQSVTATPQSLDSYIKNIAPTSPITGQQILDAANKAGVDPITLAANIQQESQFNTQGLAVRTNNPGNIGNESPTVTKTYPSIQAGLDATAKWMADHKATAPTYAQYGLLSNTDFNPNNSTDNTALNYLRTYLNGIIPSASSIGISVRGGAGQTLLGDASKRASDLYTAATGTSLPSPALQKANLALIAGNNKLANNINVQSSTVGKNFALAVENLNASNLNKNIQPINAFLDNLKNTLGDPAVSQYLAQNATLGNEIGSLLAVKNATGTTVHDKLESAGLINNKMSADQEVQVIKTILQEAQNSQSAIQGASADLYNQVDPLQLDPSNPNRQSSSGPLVSGTTHNGVNLPGGSTGGSNYQGVTLPH